MLHKALRLFRGVILDDPECAKYSIKGVPFHRNTQHSITWKLHPATAAALSAPVFVKWHKEVCSQELLSEVDFLEQLRHPNIINLVDVACINGKNCMVV